MSELTLNSLEVRGFRAFRHLRVEKLGRVNLIVGKNNVGKTALLEAIRLYGQDLFFQSLAAPPVLNATNGAQEKTTEQASTEKTDLQSQYRRFQHLFHGYPSIQQLPVEFKVGPVGEPARTWSVVFEKKRSGSINQVGPQFVTRFEEGEERRFLLGQPDTPAQSKREATPEVLFVPANGLPEKEAGNLWDEVFLEGRKKTVIEALRTVAPNVEDVEWASAPRLRYSLYGRRAVFDISPTEKRLPFVELTGRRRPLSLSSMGEGTRRLLNIGLALASAEGGLLLVDEIENGLHYSVQPDLWRLVFETAARLNVQVFATTHSMDCIRAFQQAAEDHSGEGMLVSLRRKRKAKSEVVAVLSDESSLETIVDTGIEVR